MNCPNKPKGKCMRKKRLPLHPLHEAVIQNNLEKVEQLLKNGADVNIKDSGIGFTALHFAAQDGFTEIIKLLLNNKADVAAQDEYGNSPLFIAVMSFRGNGEIITCLLQAGANRNLKNNYGHSPLELARSITNYQIFPFFDAVPPIESENMEYLIETHKVGGNR
jgi:ankyrin repeat protein